MGMPITTYNVLHALDKGQRHEIRLAQKVLAPFNLFAFIIHDPDADETSDFGQRNRAVEQKISRDFDYLDYVTGNKLLFFALADPPEKWLKHGQSRPYYKHFQRNVMTFNDRSVTAFSLAQSLRIPHEMLPCLVVTPNFSDESVVWVRTCPDHIKDQLAWLGYRSQRSQRIHAVKTFFEDIREEINLCEGSGLSFLESSLAKTLADVLSFISDSWPRARARARARVRDTLTDLYHTLAKLKNTKTLDTEELDNLCVKIVSFLSYRNDRNDLNLNDFINIDARLLEVDSQLILKTAHKVDDLLMRNRSQMIDYTPVTICLAKVFEREINLSVVHWIRDNLGINLPRFFNEYQPRITAIFNGTGQAINFNRENNGRWHPPATGEAQRAYRNVSNDLSSWLAPHLVTNFLHNWDVIRKIRNSAAHTKVLDRDSVTKVQNALNELSSSGVFTALAEMKHIGRTTGFNP